MRPPLASARWMTMCRTMHSGIVCKEGRPPRPVEVTSRANPTAKAFARYRQERKRKKAGVVVVEGRRLMASALQYGWVPERVLCTEHEVRYTEIATHRQHSMPSLCPRGSLTNTNPLTPRHHHWAGDGVNTNYCSSNMTRTALTPCVTLICPGRMAAWPRLPCRCPSGRGGNREGRHDCTAGGARYCTGPCTRADVPGE